MTERTRWWRWPDLLLVTGVILLLVPLAVADDDAKDVPTEFTTAETRVGDRAEYALFISSHNESLVQTGPFLTLEVREANAYERSYGATFTAEATFTAMRAETSWLNASSTDLVIRYTFAADGTWLTTHHTGVVANDDLFLPRSHKIGAFNVDVITGHRADAWTFPVDFAVQKEVHRPTGVGDDLSVWLHVMLDDESRVRAPYWSDGGVRLFATNHGPHMAPTDAFISQMFGFAPPRHSCQLFGLQPDVARHGLSLEHRIPADTCGRVQGFWFTPDTSLPAGSNWFFPDGQGRWWSMDLHMVSFSRGDGPPLPQPPPSTYERATGGPRIDAHNVTPEEIDRDSEPLFRNVTLPAVRAALAPETEGSVLAKAFADDALLIGYGWRETGSVARSMIEPLPLNGEARAAPEEDPLRYVYHDWELWFLTNESELIRVPFALRESLPEGTLDFDGFDLCGGKDFTCMVSERSEYAATEERLDPRSFLARGHERTTQPLTSFWSFPAISIPSETYNHTTPARPLTREFSTATTYEAGILVFRSGDVRGQLGWAGIQPETETPSVSEGHYDGYDGFIHSEAATIAPTANDWADRPLRQSAATLNVQSEHGTPTRAAGLLMVIAAAVWRVGSALAAGVHFPVVAWLYAKIRHADVLLHERRAAIMQTIAAEGGMTASEVAKRLGYGWGSTVHHLQRLVQADMLRCSVEGTQRFYVPVGREGEVGRGTINRQRLLAAIQENPGATAAELAKAVDRRRASVTRLAARLVDADLVRRERDGRKVRFYPAVSEDS